MRNILAVAGLAALVYASSTNAQSVCPDIWSPVCGTKDGVSKTYPNICEAQRDKVTEIKSGACEEKMEAGMKLCPLYVLYVCGTVDGKEKTFTNDCFAKKAGATDIHPGMCKKPKAK
jgi:hypothetical protein